MKSILAERRLDLAAKACPICGHPFTLTDLLLLEHDENFECRSCWYRIPIGGKRPAGNSHAHDRAHPGARHSGTRRAGVK